MNCRDNYMVHALRLRKSDSFSFSRDLKGIFQIFVFGARLGLGFPDEERCVGWFFYSKIFESTKFGKKKKHKNFQTLL